MGDINGDGVHDAVVGDAYSAEGRLLALRNAPFLTFDSDLIDFGPITSGDTARRTFEIGNAGVPDLNAEAAGVAGTGFAVAADGCKGRPVPAGGTCAMDLTFTPPSADFFEGSLFLGSDDPEPVVEVFLEGTGVAQGVSPPGAPGGSPLGPGPTRPVPATPVGAGAPTTRRAAADAIAAAVKALGRRGLRALARRRGVRFAFIAPAGRVDVVLAQRVRRGGRPGAALAGARALAPSSGRLTVTLRPTAAGRRLARRGRAVKATLRITVTPRGGDAVRRSAALTLRR